MNDQQFVGIHFHAVTVNCRCQFCSHSDSLHFNTVKLKLVALCVPFVFSLSSPPQLNEMLVLPAISKSSLPRRRRRHTSSTESVPLTDKTDWICVFEFLFFLFQMTICFCIYSPQLSSVCSPLPLSLSEMWILYSVLNNCRPWAVDIRLIVMLLCNKRLSFYFRFVWFVLLILFLFFCFLLQCTVLALKNRPINVGTNTTTASR